MQKKKKSTVVKLLTYLSTYYMVGAQLQINTGYLKGRLQSHL